MIEITIDIEVLNHQEILEKNKGKGLASFLGESSIVKAKVEQEIKKVIIAELSEALQKGLNENSVKSKVKIS